MKLATVMKVEQEFILMSTIRIGEYKLSSGCSRNRTDKRRLYETVRKTVNSALVVTLLEHRGNDILETVSCTDKQ